MDELIYETLVERVRKKCLLCPQLYYLHVINPGKFASMICQLSSFIFGKRLRHFLSVLSQPVSFAVLLLEQKLILDYLVNLFIFFFVELADERLEIVNLVLHWYVC